MQDYYRREKLKLEILENREEKEHFHQDIEILYVLDGELKVFMDGQKTAMRPEDILIVNSNKRHYLLSEGEVLYAKLTILYDLLSDVLNNFALVFVCDSTKNEDASYDGLRKLIQRLLSHYLGNRGNEADFIYISICYQIMDYVSKVFLIRSAETEQELGSDKYQLRIRQIDNYIRANYRSAISIKDLSEKLYLSSGYLSRFFKKNYGMSFAEYLTHIRLYHAVDQLIYTDTPITHIVYDNGFASVAIFNRAFKKEYGETPSEVRKRASQVGQKKTAHPLDEALEKKLENVLWKDIREPDPASDRIEVVLSVKETSHLDHIWSRAINIGAAEDMLHSEVQEHVALLKMSLHFQAVRFWNPFTRELFIDINNPGQEYNFSRLDSIFDFLLRYDIRPFIDLGSKPRRVVENINRSLIFETVENMQSMDNWRNLLEAFMRHIVLRYGRDEVSRWRFELWFDADRMRDDLQILTYAQRFRVAQEIIHRYSDAKIGGCGMHTYSRRIEKKSEYIRSFYKKAEREGFHPDFFTVYIYAYDTMEEDGKTLSVPSMDTEYVEHAIDNLRYDLGEKLEGTPLYVSEWNLTFSDRNLINDVCYKGAYIVKNYIALTGKADGMVYFRGTDRVSEFYDTNDFLFGGTGLLTKDGVKKPMAFAFEFLNKLYSEFVGKGENYIVTTDGHDNYAIVCHNCRALGYNYFHIEENNLDRNHLAKYFEDLDQITISLELTGVREGKYQIKIWQLNAENGSVYRKWQETDYEKDLGRDDITYLQRVSEPKLSMQKKKAEDGRLRLEITMAANEIARLSVFYLGK